MTQKLRSLSLVCPATKVSMQCPAEVLTCADPVMPLLEISPKKTGANKEVCPGRLMEALSLLRKHGNNLNVLYQQSYIMENSNDEILNN